MKFDPVELKKQKKRNFTERLAFIDQYVDWLKRTPNRVWSEQLKDFHK